MTAGGGPAAGGRSPRRVALITGGNRGIGLGIAEALARDGLDLMICGVEPEAAAACARLAATGVAAHYVTADIADAADRDRLVDAVWARFGRLDVLVNNAGIAPKTRADILDAELASFERLVQVNLQGPYFLTQAVARRMLADAVPVGPRAVVFITSVSATVASVDRGDYCISKAGLAMAARLWAVRLAEHGIPVYELRPGVIRTDMTAGVTEKYDRLIADGLTLERRWGAPADIGRAVAALVRGDLPYATGQVLTLDGGLSVATL